jgi:hypothetical protein
MLSAPALRADSIPSLPMAWAATFLPSRCASSTMAFASSSVKLTQECRTPSLRKYFRSE